MIHRSASRVPSGKMSWQKHTVRGFMGGAMKKAGYTVEVSLRPASTPSFVRTLV